MTPPAGALAEALPRHRPAPRRTPVRHPRRISGPATRPARSARPISRAGSVAVPRSRTAPRTNSPGLAHSPGLALRALAAYERVADSALLDRLVRGRLWIGLLAFALIGIVAMQLMVLKLNAGIGTTLQREAALQRTNAQLGIEAATGTGEGRIEPLAAATGMTFAPSGSVHFVASNPAVDVSHAVAVLAAPIQPHEGTAASPETQTGSGEAGAGSATGETRAASSETSPSGGSGAGETGSGRSGSGAGETPSGHAAASESGSTGSSETPAHEARGSEASAATGESEASASAAGGVAAGH